MMVVMSLRNLILFMVGTVQVNRHYLDCSVVLKTRAYTRDQ